MTATKRKTLKLHLLIFVVHCIGKWLDWRNSRFFSNRSA